MQKDIVPFLCLSFTKMLIWGQRHYQRFNFSSSHFVCLVFLKLLQHCICYVIGRKRYWQNVPFWIENILMWGRSRGSVYLFAVDLIWDKVTRIKTMSTYQWSHSPSFPSFADWGTSSMFSVLSWILSSVEGTGRQKWKT